MPRVDIIRECKIERTPRVLQAEGIFDIPPSERAAQTWAVNLPLDEKDWNIGLIVGPSGSGKTTVAREMFQQSVIDRFDWSESRSVLDDFPREMSIKDIIELLSSVGFSSPPSWLKPYKVLSTGEQFRVHVARVLAENKELAVVDEFTSVVDRTVAQIGSAAVAKAVRRRGQKLVAVSCHYDIIDWLTPDWIYQPHTNEFAWGSQRRRPPIELQIRRVHRSAWNLFRAYHYLDTNLNPTAQCFVAFWKDTPVAFASFIHMPGVAKNLKREHRTVCLPDFQGVGIGNALSAFIASICKAVGFRYRSVTTNPGMIAARNKSTLWQMARVPSVNAPHGHAAQMKWSLKNRRCIASFEYVGPAADVRLAKELLA